VPHERFSVLVVGGDELLDFHHQLLYIAEGTCADRPLRDNAEPPLHLVQPRGVGGGEVRVMPRVACKPPFELGMFMR